VQGDFNKFITWSRDIINNDGFPSAGEVRFIKNIAAWLAIGDVDPNFGECGCGC